MNNKEHFDFLVKGGFKLDDIKAVHSLVQLLLEALQKPALNSIMVLDRERLVEFGLDPSEPVNWADLKVIMINKIEGVYLVDIEEASQGECPTLCAYIEKYMRAWGWEVNVRTEW